MTDWKKYTKLERIKIKVCTKRIRHLYVPPYDGKYYLFRIYNQPFCVARYDRKHLVFRTPNGSHMCAGTLMDSDAEWTETL